ncbi:MAG TPA: metal-dependent transcriptional regulator [candidate division Zixibacteria bacterium]|nr:metal-dependent transcriptional regulator [candidate division Zixibacteria bacterium]
MTETRSESVEMYLKTVAELGGEHAPVSIGRVAGRLGISPVSASEMMKRLGDLGYIQHLPYKGVELTGEGRQLANSVIRRQRLWECFLVDQLDIDWAQSYDLACSLEHATAPQVTQALSNYLENPRRCPHGNPIPNETGETENLLSMPLTDLQLNKNCRIEAIVPENSDILSYLAERKLWPGTELTLIAAAPLEGPLTLLVGEDEIVIGLNLAERILVSQG